MTGTGTGVGKTVTTAALAAALHGRGLTVGVVKPTQTGVAEGEPGDVEEIRRLIGDDAAVRTHELVRLRDPLAPDTAARLEGVDLPRVEAVAESVKDLARDVDVLLVEGAGGLLVRLDGAGGTLADLGTCLHEAGVTVGYLVVAAAELGTLNHTALTAEALASRGLPLLGVVIGSWPQQPGLAEEQNLVDLPAVAQAPLVGRLPAGAAALSPSDFRDAAPSWWHPDLLPAVDRSGPPVAPKPWIQGNKSAGAG
ncbi:dethiobiotin synthase [Nostocoides sp. HKS02]|uniref:dethiobiotin synthase n=1 Tax=Nostocoides sp. HKS02 TaxID=1813880 RepID=UPI001E61418E|nr:dethiobiotin synthase [Tetrasphaera sp. HKS02]